MKLASNKILLAMALAGSLAGASRQASADGLNVGGIEADARPGRPVPPPGRPGPGPGHPGGPHNPPPYNPAPPRPVPPPPPPYYPPPPRPLPPPPPPYYPPAPPPYYPPAPPPAYNDYLEQYLGQYMVGNNELHLRAILGIGPQFNGRRIEFVKLRARTDAGHGQAQLVINGWQSGMSQTVGVYSQDYYFYPDAANDVLGTEVATLQLHLQGRFTVESVAVKFGYGGYDPSPRRLDAYVARNYVGQNSLYLTQLFDLNRLEGRRIRSVTLRASTAQGMGQASFCERGYCGYAQTVGTYVSTYVLNSGSVAIDRYSMQDLRIDLRGNFFVDSVTLEIE